MPKTSLSRIDAAILETPPAYHGAFDYAELERLGLEPDAIVDFSVNSNPYGPPPGVHEAIAAVPLDRYPDRECLALRRTLADQLAVDADHIVVGNGSAELLQLIAQAFIRAGDRVLIPAPTFGEYQRVAQLAGARVDRFDPVADDGLDGARMVFLCNPNNPDGRHIPAEDLIQRWLRPNPDTLFVVDEAYANFLERPQSLIGCDLPNLLVLRSLTKDYALAGLRLGYLVGAPDLIEPVRRVRQAWNVNALAQAAGVAVLQQHDWLAECVTRLHRGKASLQQGLRELGLAPEASSVQYFLLPVGDAADFRARILGRGVMLRDCTSFGLPDRVRIATRTEADNARLLAAIAAES